MSRSTVFAFVGATIGFVVTGGSPAGAQWGWIIGSGVGALTDNTKTYGPRAGDASQQTSQDGTICTYGYGEFATTGVILWRDERKEKEEEQGKGGPKNVTYSYTWTYAIGVCKGPIAGYLIIKRNGTVVFDARTNAELAEIGYTSAQIAETRAAQAKFLKYAKFYLGDNEQMPDPSIQAVKGVNNVPAYRGRAYIVMTDDPVTDDGAAIPNYEFVVATCGTESTELGVERFMAFGVAGAGFRAASRPLDYSINWVGASDADVYATNNTTAFGFAVFGGKAFSITKDGNSAIADLSTLDTWAAGPTGGSTSSVAGWLVSAAGKLWQSAGTAGVKYLDAPSDAAFQTVATFGGRAMTCLVGVGTGVIATSQLGKVYYAPSGTTTFTEVNDRYLPAGMELHAGSLASNGTRVILCGFRYAPTVEYSDDAGSTFTAATFPATGNPQPLCARYCGGTRWLVGCSAGSASTGLFMSTDNAVTFAAVTLPHIVSIGAGGIAIDGISGRCVVYGTQVGTSTGRGYWTDDYVTWNEIDFTGTAAKNIVFAIYPPGTNFVPTGIEIPDAPGSYVAPVSGVITTTTGSGLQPCEYTLDEIVLDQCAIRSVTRVDATQLEDDVVRGFRVATQTSPKDNIRALQGAYFFDGSDYDGRLHFIKRPQPDTFFISMDDLVDRGDKPIEWEITKENDLLRKVSVNYFDPRTNYTITAQDYERAIATIKAQGEGVFDSALTANKDFIKQMAEKSVLVAWAERDMLTVKVRLNHAARVTGEWGKLEDEFGQIHTVRITHIKNEGITRVLTLRKTRRSAYSSRAVGLASPNPTFPGSGIRGPNVSVIMNMPGLRLEDDKAGVYWASTGLMRSWRGAVLELSRAGGAWELGPTVTAPCTMGALTEALPYAPRYGRDDVNILTVQLYAYTPKTLANATDEDLLAEKNAAALVYPDGKVEIIQFKNATLVGDRLYEITGLYRGCKDTAPGEHLAGAIFVLLDDAIKFVTIRPDDVGKTLSFRSTSLGTDPDFADTDTLTMGSIESLREWQPYHVVVESDGAGGFCVKWIGRARFGTSRAPVHSQWFAGYRVRFTANGVFYEVDTTEQQKCVAYAALAAELGSTFGWPDVTVRAVSKITTNDDDFDSPTSPPPVTPTPVAITRSGAPASPVVGPNGGFKDDIPYPIPQPTVFGTNVVQGGTFSGPSDLSKWRDGNGNPLDSRWSLVGGRLCFFGTGTASAFNWEARRTMAQQVLPHYGFDVTGQLQSDAGAKGAIGVGMAFSTGGNSFTAVRDIDMDNDGTLEHPMSELTEYGAVTTVAHYFEDKRNGYSSTAAGQLVVTIVAPAVTASVEGEPKRVYFDVIEMEITENAPATTPQTIANLDFSAGLTDWVEFPPSSPLSPSPVVSGGRAIFTPVSEYGTHKYIININAIPDLDTLDKWLELMGKTWCNDSTVYSGMTQSGVGLQFAVSLDGGATFNYTAWANAVERGDWTARKRWIRQSFMYGGLTFHVCVLFKCKLGFSAGVEDLAANVTTAPVT